MRSNAAAGGAAESRGDTLHLEEYLPHQLSVTSRQAYRWVAQRYLEAFGLTAVEVGVLTTIGGQGVSSPTAISDATSMDKVKVSRATASLVRRGLVKQTTNPTDSRGRMLRLTRKGTKIHNGIVPLTKEIEATLAAGLSKSERATFNEALVKLRVHLQMLEGHHHENGRKDVLRADIWTQGAVKRPA